MALTHVTDSASHWITRTDLKEKSPPVKKRNIRQIRYFPHYGVARGKRRRVSPDLEGLVSEQVKSTVPK